MTKKVRLPAALEVRRSAIHGRGVFATEDIPAGTLIGRYGGQRFATGDEHPGRELPGLTYLFGLSDGSYIDGARGGNATRFINHSCAPNCVAMEMEMEIAGRLSIVIESLHPIRPDEELLLDYALELGDADAGTYECRCGAAGCRGTMAGRSRITEDEGSATLRS